MIQKMLNCYGGPAAAVVLTALIWFSSFDILQVQENSMEPVLHNGQTILVNKLAYKRIFNGGALPEAQDIVIFRSPGERRLVVKRCRLLPGQSVQINHRGWLIVDGEEFFLTETQKDRLSRTPVVPENSILVLGDNPFHSVDSRDYGYVPVSEILGKVIRPFNGKIF